MSKRVLLFPGQGAHIVGMGKDLYELYPSVRALYEQADSLVDFELRTFSFEGPEEELRRTDVSQPAIVVASLAALRALESELGGTIPGVAAAAGMSLGEYSALTYAGVLSLGDALRLVALRGRLMQDCCEAQPGGMTTLLGLKPELLEAVIEAGAGLGVLGVANDNSPRQLVLSGEQAALDAAAEKAKELGAKRVIPLKVAGAYHSRLMAPAGEKLRSALEAASWADPALPVLANIDARPYGGADEVVDKLVRQVSGTVRWRESMGQLAELGISDGLELGPGGVLRGLMRQNVRSIAVSSILSVEDVKAAAAALKG